MPSYCDACGAGHLQTAGQGTEKLDETLTKLFPDFPVARLDRDSIKHKGQLEATFQRILSGEARILTGTQMLTKGHHFPMSP